MENIGSKETEVINGIVVSEYHEEDGDHRVFYKLLHKNKKGEITISIHNTYESYYAKKRQNQFELGSMVKIDYAYNAGRFYPDKIKLNNEVPNTALARMKSLVDAYEMYMDAQTTAKSDNFDLDAEIAAICQKVENIRTINESILDITLSTAGEFNELLKSKKTGKEASTDACHTAFGKCNNYNIIKHEKGEEILGRDFDALLFWTRNKWSESIKLDPDAIKLTVDNKIKHVKKVANLDVEPANIINGIKPKLDKIIADHAVELTEYLKDFKKALESDIQAVSELSETQQSKTADIAELNKTFGV